MRSFLLAISLLAGSALSGNAANVPLCSTGSFSSYLALGSQGCSVGNLDFTDFSDLTAEPGSSAIAPADIVVSPISGGLLFTFDLTAGSNQFLDTVFGYDVSLDNGGVTGASLGISASSGSSSGGATGVETVCVGGITASGICAGGAASRNLAVFAVAGVSQTSDAVAFGSLSPLGVSLDLSADGGRGGSATLGAVSTQFSTNVAAVPEPGTLGLALLSAAGLILVSARKRILRKSS